jgi:branched-chain amino acid transport system ATP-binding protein
VQLEVKDLVVGYGRIQVLNGVDLAVPPGKVVGVLGPNGAGKTTLLRTIAGLNRPWSGTVNVDGKDIARSGVATRARSGMCLIPEGRAIFRDLTVAENISVHAQKRRSTEAVDIACEVFPVLGKRLKQIAGTLSGGEQQMLAMSRPLVRKSPLVIADELSFGLAPIAIDLIFDALKTMREMGSSMLIVEQYAERLLAFSDYIYLLKKGDVILEGEPASLNRDDLWRSQNEDAAPSPV